MLERLTWRGGIGQVLLQSAALIGAILVLLVLYRGLGLPAENWAMISLVLVLQPQAKASVRLAAIRVATNLLGAGVAWLALQIGGSSIPAIVAAMLTIGLLCHLFSLDEGVRTAYVSVAIVMSVDSMAMLSPPLDRISAVTFGSLIGVVASLVIEAGQGWWQRRTANRAGFRP